MSGIFGINPAWGITPVRIAMGLIFIVAGYQKFAGGVGAVSAYFAKMSIPLKRRPAQGRGLSQLKNHHALLSSALSSPFNGPEAARESGPPPEVLDPVDGGGGGLSPPSLGSPGPPFLCSKLPGGWVFPGAPWVVDIQHLCGRGSGRHRLRPRLPPSRVRRVLDRWGRPADLRVDPVSGARGGGVIPAGRARGPGSRHELELRARHAVDPLRDLPGDAGRDPHPVSVRARRRLCRRTGTRRRMRDGLRRVQPVAQRARAITAGGRSVR